MALNPSNSSNFEELASKGFNADSVLTACCVDVCGHYIQSRQFSRATQTGSLDRPVPYVVVTSPSPDDHRHEPALVNRVSSLPRASAVTKDGSSGRGRLHLSAISNTPESAAVDHNENTAACLPPSSDVVDGRQRLMQQGGTSTVGERVGNRRLTAADGDDDGMRLRNEQAEVQELLRELGVEPSSEVS